MTIMNCVIFRGTNETEMVPGLHPSLYFIRFRDLQILLSGHDFCEGQMINKLTAIFASLAANTLS